MGMECLDQRRRGEAEAVRGRHLKTNKEGYPESGVLHLPLRHCGLHHVTYLDVHKVGIKITLPFMNVVRVKSESIKKLFCITLAMW